ncbi:hypothetical protein [Thalassovita sp.]|uniref:hypothetical protein n=1 Tax=Thalassovita sp. TaxID=1979401 RepID=UPI00288128C1|nr:hypothetical protein [Thalassovita sp.]MDF1802440.1 hypothetical protein [Thalassovita sp.]
MRGACALVVVLILSGCLPSGADKDTVQDAPPPRQAFLLDGRVVIPAPAGYCVDQASLRDQSRAGFVLIAGCDGLMGLPSGTLVAPAIMTVSVVLPKEGATETADIAHVLGDGEVLSRSEQNGLTLVQVENAALVPEGVAPRHWRGAMRLNGVLLTMAVYGDSSMPGPKGKALLNALARGIRSHNAR